MDKEQLVEAIKDLQEAHPEANITFDFFLANTDATQWSVRTHFGTFNELKSAAGIRDSRIANEVKNKTRLHASLDRYRALNVEAEGLDNRYNRDSASDTKTILVAGDIHDEEVDPFYLRVLKRAAEIVQPDVMNFNGDTLDCPEFGKYHTDPREWGPVRRIKFVHENVFKPLREICPDAQFDMIEGNHEYRTIQHLANESPATMEILDELHGFTIQKLFGLDEFQINFVSKSDFAAYTKSDIKKEIAKNYRVYWDNLMTHHFPDGRSYGIPGINGHHHNHIVWNEYNHSYGSYEWHQSGCGHQRRAVYAPGEKWSLGFVIATVHTPSKSVIFDYVDCTNDIAVVAGEFMYRTEIEKLPCYSPENASSFGLVHK